MFHHYLLFAVHRVFIASGVCPSPYIEMSKIILDFVQGMSGSNAVNILGRQVDLSSAELVKQLLSSFVWVTYRHDFAPLPGTAFITDSGWGCMIRCGQMLTASALLRMHLGECTLGCYGLELTLNDSVSRCWRRAGGA